MAYFQICLSGSNNCNPRVYSKIFLVFLLKSFYRYWTLRRKLLDTEQETSGLLSKFPPRVVKTAFYVVIGTFWWKNIFSRKYIYFWLFELWAKSFRPFVKNFRELIKTAFDVSRGTFRWKILFSGKVNVFFKSLSRFWATNLWFLSDFFQGDSKNCSLRVHKKVFRKFFSPGRKTL